MKLAACVRRSLVNWSALELSLVDRLSHRFPIIYRLEGNNKFTVRLIMASPLVGTRDIQTLPTTPCSVVLRKEYFDCPQRDSHAVHYTKKMGERGICTLVL